MAGLALTRLLGIQRQLYELPRGRQRFERYLEVMTGGGRDLELPLSLFNPMAKDHAAAILDELLEMDAETVAARAIEEAARRLPPDLRPLRLGLVLVDDAKGGWTNRYFTEMKHRMEPQAELVRGWITVLLWTSERPDEERLRRETLAAIYRAYWVLARGRSRRLDELLFQEGLAGVFSGAEGPRLEREVMNETRRLVASHRGSEHGPTIFTCLFGDAAAREVGYEPAGLAPRAGLALALAEARESSESPESVLSSAMG